MRLQLWGPMQALARRERALGALGPKERAAALAVAWDVQILEGTRACDAALLQGAGRDYAAPFHLRSSAFSGALRDSGLALLRGSAETPTVEPFGPELRASLWAAALPLEELVSRFATDPEAALAIALGVARALAAGRSPVAVMELLPMELPYEAVLHRAAILRALAVAYAPAVPAESVSSALAELLDLLWAGSEEPPKLALPLQRQLVDAALLLVGAADPAGQKRALTIGLEQLAAAALELKESATEEPPLDEFLGTVLSGGSAQELTALRGRTYQRYAASLACLLGGIVAAEPTHFAALQAGLAKLPDDAAAALAPAFLGGLALGLGSAGLPELLVPSILKWARADDAATRQEALRALSRGAEPAADAVAALARGVRDPVESVRASVAAMLLSAGRFAAPLLRRLCSDPAPRVRAAAAWSALGRGEVDDDFLSELAADLTAAGPEGRVGAAMAAACLGATNSEVAELLVPLAAGMSPEEGADWVGLGRFDGTAWALAAWAAHDEGRAELYRRAVGSPTWLAALGAAMESEFGRLDDAQGELRAGLRGGAILLLRDEEELPRLRACRVLGAYLDSDARAVDLLLVNELSMPVLRTLAALTADLSLVRPQWVSRLLRCLDGELDGELDDDSGEAAAELAMSCLAGLSDPRDAAVGRALAARVDGQYGDAAYRALCRLLSRGTVCG